MEIKPGLKAICRATVLCVLLQAFVRSYRWKFNYGNLEQAQVGPALRDFCTAVFLPEREQLDVPTGGEDGR